MLSSFAKGQNLLGGFGEGQICLSGFNLVIFCVFQ